MDDASDRGIIEEEEENCIYNPRDNSFPFSFPLPSFSWQIIWEKNLKSMSQS